MSNVKLKVKNNDSLSEIVFNHMQEGIIVLDQQLNIISLNPWAQKVTDFTEEEILGKPFSMLFHHLAEYETVTSKVCSEGKWKGEVTKIRKNKDVYPEWMNIRKVSQADGTTNNYVVVFRDITKQKHSQKEIRLAAKVLENTSEGVLITDEKGTILSVNPAFEVVTGYTKEEVLGLNPSLLQSGIHDQTFYNEMWTQIKKHGSWKGEIWNKRKNGEIFPEWLTISSIKDDEGKVTNHVAVFSDITDRKHAEDQLRKLAHFDALTGVANRYSLNKRLNSLIETAAKYNQQLAILFLDLDRFKQINDTLGHSYGDLLLKKVSERLKNLIKNKDMIARLGGDEFVIVLPNIKHPREAVHIAENIIHSLTQSFLLENQEVYISTSIGISLYPLDGLSMESLIRNADKAMYQAKSSGRNQYELYHSDMHQDETKQLKMENYLRKAVEKDEFFLVYHPQVDSETREIIGVEALLRWKQEEMGIVSPADFIPLAEETGLIIPISEWVLKKACEDIQNLHLLGFSKIRMSVNISAYHFNQDSFVKSIYHTIHHTNVNPHLLELELTESMIMPKATESINKLVKLKQLGLKLSVDDFGTGYSSLSYLNRFPIDTLKIDQSFIKKLGVYEEDISIVQAIITMAHRLHLKVVAEGVETKKQFDFLKEENCDIIQGYYITKPLELHDLIYLLENWDQELLK
ncbi:EAL domain-containing protein [Bacillus sp. 31A1R]|uniref:EAL domain-containing protein n=1 Tax=Robertmurraya mangrovi TaxID=3098077 RepID=A0ABU5J1D2_9BACI|nr:EAL domain-containing protein [Bacillus sp. 31A1R]MDZ5473204.1 EAL domain-containing protein [Bacillus sp. 31A1R]